MRKKRQIVVINKIDALSDDETKTNIMDKFQKELDIRPHFISSVTGKGVGPLVKLLGKELESIKAEEIKDQPDDMKSV